MKIQTTVHNIELTAEISSYLEKRLSTLNKLVSESAIVNVILGKVSNHHKNGEVFTTEMNLMIGGQQFFAKTEQESLFASIDIAKDELAHTLRHSKSKKETLWKRGHQKVKNLIQGLKF